MSDLVRSTALFRSARVPAVGPSGVLGTVPNPPPQVSQLPVGTTVAGVVVGHDAEGHTLVRTDLGTLGVATKAQLPVNSEVTLQIRSSGGQLQVLIMHSEVPLGGPQGTPALGPQGHAGAHPGGAQTGTAQAGGTGPQPQPVAAQAGHGPAADLLTLGQSVRAVVQSPATRADAAAGRAAGGAPPVGPALAAVAAQLAPGSELQLRILTVQAPGPQGQAPGAQAPAARAAGSLAPGPQLSGSVAPAPAGSRPGVASQVASYAALQAAAGPAAAEAGAAPSAARLGTPATLATADPAAAPGGPNAPTAAGRSNPAPHPATTRGPATAGSPSPGAGAPAAAATAAQGAVARPAGIGGAPQGQAASGTNPSATPGAAPANLPGAAARAGSGGTSAAAAQPATAAPATPGPGTGLVTASPRAPSSAGETGTTLRFTGSVSTVTHAGQPVLQTPLGTLTLEIRAPLQVGSRVTFELPGTAMPPPNPTAAPAAASLSTLAHSWPALDEALQTLQEVGVSGAATAAALEAIPQPGARLASGLLFFLSALSGGDVTRWLGNQAAQALKAAGRDSLLSRLGRDFGQLSRLADSPGGDWRLFFIPLFDGEQIRQLRLFLRHGQQDGSGGGNGGNDEEQTRFVVEVEMSRLGDLQLDGLVRDKRLDLILRSRAPLPEFMRRDIMQIFHGANEITGYRGSIGFQASADWKAMPIEASAEAASPGVVV